MYVPVKPESQSVKSREKLYRFIHAREIQQKKNEENRDATRSQSKSIE